MLRRKLLLILGSLVVVLLVAAIGAILLMQNVLADLSHINEEAIASSSATSQFRDTLSLLEIETNRLLQNDADDPPINLRRVVEVLEDQGRRLEEPFHALEPALAEVLQRIASVMPSLSGQIDRVGGESIPDETPDALGIILSETSTLRLYLVEYTRLAGRHTELEHGRLVSKFRNIMLGLGFIFLVVLNGCIVGLLNAATMILKPVNALIDGSRRLAREEFNHRLTLDRHDEFGELATSFNRLAEQLHQNELRKIEMMHQVARTLNHELNNALSVIELQLKIVEKSRSDKSELAEPLRQIHETLMRIGKTVDALKRVRRIVLTDYVSGMKMLDLERSVEAEPPSPQIETRSLTETGLHEPNHHA